MNYYMIQTPEGQLLRSTGSFKPEVTKTKFLRMKLNNFPFDNRRWPEFRDQGFRLVAVDYQVKEVLLD